MAFQQKPHNFRTAEVNRMQNSRSYYDLSYFDQQKDAADHNSHAIMAKFAEYIIDTDRILDFGCGSGYLLNRLECAEKHGFDINNSALEHAEQFGIITHRCLSNIEDKFFDVIISNSALEHTPDPRQSLLELKKKLKVGGTIVFRVPHETLGWSYKEGDWNYHLFTWSPMALGNLFNDCGYVGIKVQVEKRKSPLFQQYYEHIPILLHLFSKTYRLLRLILDELGIKPIGVDGYSFLVAKND